MPNYALGQQVQHGKGEDVAGCAVKRAAFAHSHGDRAAEQADASSEDMQNQEREPHCSHPYPLHPAGWL